MKKVQKIVLVGGLLTAGLIWSKVALDYMDMAEETEQLRQRVAAIKPCPVCLSPKSPMRAEATTLARKNLNFLNVKGTGWVGQIGNDKFGHAIFSSLEYGIRAGSFVLKNYAKRHKISTVEGIVDRFCEAKGKTRAAYIRHICKALGVKADEKFDLIKSMPILLRAMVRFESGETLPERYFAPYDLLAKL